VTGGWVQGKGRFDARISMLPPMRNLGRREARQGTRGEGGVEVSARLNQLALSLKTLRLQSRAGMAGTHVSLHDQQGGKVEEVFPRRSGLSKRGNPGVEPLMSLRDGRMQDETIELTQGFFIGT
jgi:hypothetical protein